MQEIKNDMDDRKVFVSSECKLKELPNEVMDQLLNALVIRIEEYLNK